MLSLAFPRQSGVGIGLVLAPLSVKPASLPTKPKSRFRMTTHFVTSLASPEAWAHSAAERPTVRRRYCNLEGRNMKAGRTTPTSIGEYIAVSPPEVRSILERIRVTIKEAAPAAEEKISYQMPTFTLNGNLVHFAAFKKHIGFYPPVRDKKLKADTSIYAGEKGNLRFPLDKPIPYALINKLVKARVRENQERADGKRKKG